MSLKSTYEGKFWKIIISTFKVLKITRYRI